MPAKEKIKQAAKAPRTVTLPAWLWLLIGALALLILALSLSTWLSLRALRIERAEHKRLMAEAANRIAQAEAAKAQARHQGHRRATSRAIRVISRVEEGLKKKADQEAKRASQEQKRIKGLPVPELLRRLRQAAKER